MEHTYQGYRTEGRAVVLRDGVRLDPRPSQRLINHSPDGFEWGYGGSGPAQLALALLLDATEDKSTAMRFYQEFKGEYVSVWRERWKLTAAEIREWLGLYSREV